MIFISHTQLASWGPNHFCAVAAFRVEIDLAEAIKKLHFFLEWSAQQWYWSRLHSLSALRQLFPEPLPLRIRDIIQGNSSCKKGVDLAWSNLYRSLCSCTHIQVFFSLFQSLLRQENLGSAYLNLGYECSERGGTSSQYRKGARALVCSPIANFVDFVAISPLQAQTRPMKRRFYLFSLSPCILIFSYFPCAFIGFHMFQFWTSCYEHFLSEEFVLRPSPSDPAGGRAARASISAEMEDKRNEEKDKHKTIS